MPPSLLGWLCIVLPFLTTATPQATPSNASTSSLPAKLQTDLPACAQPCVQKSLAEQFPLACTVPFSLNCLCSIYSLDGETLGEVALGCVYESCDSVDESAAEAYNICFGQAGAVSPTHSVLTVPARTSMVSATVTSTSSVALSSKSSVAFTSTSSVAITITTVSSTITSTPNIQSSQTSSSDTIIVDSISTVPTATATPSPTQSASAATSPPTMKTAQIVGISIAAVATFAIAIGLIFLSVFLRKRRDRKKEEAINEKSGWHPSPGGYSREPSQSFRRSGSTLNLSNQFPIPPVPALRRPTNDNKPPTPPIKDTPTIRIIPSSSPPPEQIGLAISAEQPRQSTITGGYVPPARRLSFRPQRPLSVKRHSTASQRPESNVTQYTVFEEDDVDVAEPRRQSILLPTPPMPIPPIRSFQPSRPPPQPRPNVGRPAQAPPQPKKPRQRSELFLDIPVRHSRMLPPTPVSNGKGTAPKPQLAPAIRFVPPQKPVPTDAKTPESQHSSGIPSYYFTSHRHQTPKDSRTDSPQRLHEPAQYSNTKTKLTSSNVSRSSSHASTNLRDSWSSQTSFESADDDPTPENEINNKLSPVAESPISNLRYPKVPRASNQMVPRSPKSMQSRNSEDSMYWLPEPSSLQSKRRGEQGALQLGSMVSTGSPLQSDVRSHMRQYRQHLRSNSVDDWSSMQNSERSTKTQSGMWPPKSPMMYEPEVVRPLSIRPKPNQQFLQTPRADMDELKSPVWVPRLTPTRQGEDLLISVTYSKPRQ